jgi:hypothetical protein
MEDMVESALDGYNITVFAYGQTGAGKTHTMYGSAAQPGVSPRTIQAVFDQIEANKDHLEVKVEAYMIELYNNKVLDLLLVTQEGSDRKIRYDPSKGEVFFEPMPTVRPCTSVAEMEALLEEGSNHRKVAFTSMNTDSSRSHLFLTIVLNVTSKETGKTTRSKINLIDLAGSERLKKSNASGQQQQEGIEINKSLTALGDVIESLVAGKKRTEVPYRNHRLTQILQDALGGTSKTLMFVCTRPDKDNVDETQTSLKYASRARKIVNKQTNKKK